MNRVGSDGKGHGYSGDSQVLDFQGESLLDAGDADGVFFASLSAAQLAAYRERFPAMRDADAFDLHL
ncbi:C-N hydrolase family amidase [compost metagenome]